jgi:hypothetical protein
LKQFIGYAGKQPLQNCSVSSRPDWLPNTFCRFHRCSFMVSGDFFHNVLLVDVRQISNVIFVILSSRVIFPL